MKIQKNNTFEIDEEEMIPNSMLTKSLSQMQVRNQNPISNLNFNMPYFGDSEKDQLRIYADRKKSGESDDFKDVEMKNEENPSKDKTSFSGFSPGINSGTEV